MADEMRSCRRTACRWPAAASLSFRYATREVWLLDLSEEPDPSLYDLCPHHADCLTVPVGWERVDQRTDPAPRAEPAGRDLVPDSRRTGPDRADNRYAELSRQLPRLAAAWAAGEGADEDEESYAEQRQPAMAGRSLAHRSAHRAAAAEGEGTGGGPRGDDADGSELLGEPDDAGEYGGQLAIPVDELGGEDAVVVSIGLAGRVKRD